VTITTNAVATKKFSLVLEIFTCVNTWTCYRTCLWAWIAIINVDILALLDAVDAAITHFCILLYTLRTTF